MGLMIVVGMGALLRTDWWLNRNLIALNLCFLMNSK